MKASRTSQQSSPGTKSSPRLAARDGMEQKPYEFRSHAAGIKG